MNRAEYLNKLSHAQHELNNLLLQSHQHNVNYNLQINNANCVENDIRKVIGINVFDGDPIYTSDGVP